MLPLGNLDVLATMQHALGSRMFVAAGEFLPFDTRAYYHELLSAWTRAAILIPYVVETLRLADGGYVAADGIHWRRRRKRRRPSRASTTMRPAG